MTPPVMNVLYGRREQCEHKRSQAEQRTENGQCSEDIAEGFAATAAASTFVLFHNWRRAAARTGAVFATWRHQRALQTLLLAALQLEEV